MFSTEEVFTRKELKLSPFQNQVFVKYWLHNGMINLSGQKMSKSEGNIKLLNEYIDKFGGNVIRFFFLRLAYFSRLHI